MRPLELADPGLYALLAAVHGVLALGGLAALVHPIWRLRPAAPPSPRTRRSAVLALVLVSLPWGLGWLVYPSYRALVKPGLLARARPWALAFETKEHLALMALALTWGGVGVLLAAGPDAVGRRAARALLLAALLCGSVVAALGLAVANGAP